MIACLLVADGALGQAAAAQTGTVFIVRRGWHIDVGMDVDELAEPLHSVAAGFPGVRYLFFGFGDRRYLTTQHRGAPTLLRALWPGPALLLVTALRAAPGKAFGAPHVVELLLSRGGLLRMQAFMWQALTDDQQAALAASDGSDLPAAGILGPYEGGAFFDSRNVYSAFHTCNTWAAEALGSAGVPIRSRGVLFAGQLWRQLNQKPVTKAADDSRPIEPTQEKQGAAAMAPLRTQSEN